MQLSRRRVLLGTAALAGCLGRPESSAGGAAVDGTSSRAATGTSEATTSPRAADGPPLSGTGLPVEWELETLREAVVAGGPPKDGIPSIDDPQFSSAAAADDRLAPDDVVFGLVRGDDVRAYPQYVMVWHEICNDVVGGDRVSVTYCPLTGTAMGFERGATTFGVSGSLVNNNLIMYDRASDSRWPQVLATAIEGPFAGRSLREFRLDWTTWERWRTAHPETRVLTESTGYVRDYGRDPYGSYNPPGGYYTSEFTLFERLYRDDRRPTKAVVLCSRTPDGRVAFALDALRSEAVGGGEVGETPYVAVYDAALDTGYVYRNPEGVEFAPVDGAVEGPEGRSYPTAALPLDRQYAFEGMWFAWAGFYPSTEVYGRV